VLVARSEARIGRAGVRSTILLEREVRASRSSPPAPRWSFAAFEEKNHRQGADKTPRFARRDRG